MKTIRELSDFLGISRVALYKKLNYSLKEELTGHVFKLENKTYIDDEGEQIIINSLTQERKEMIRTNDELASCIQIDEPCLPELVVDDITRHTESNYDSLSSLKAELAEKDRVIKELMQQNIDLINIFNVHDSLQIQEKLLMVKMHELSAETNKPRFFSRMFGEKTLRK